MPQTLKPPSLTLLRSFSTARSLYLPVAATSTKSKTRPPPPPPPFSLPQNPPPYPYGPSQTYKVRNSGLYGNAHIQFGNIVSPRNAIKTRRTWHPNIHNKRLWSDALQKFIQVKIQARVLRTIDKVGGLDAYLLGDTPGRVKELGVEGWRLRWMVLRSSGVREGWAGERERLGLPVGGFVREVGKPLAEEGEAESMAANARSSVMREVGKTSEQVIEKIATELKPEEATSTTTPSAMEQPALKETTEQRIARTARNIEREHGNPIENIRPSELHGFEVEEGLGMTPRNSTARPEEQGMESGAGAEQQERGQDYVQADDSKSVLGKIKGIFKK